MTQHDRYEPGEYVGGEVPHETVGPQMFAPHLAEHLQNPALANFGYPITDVDGNRHLVTPEDADSVEHDPQTGLNFLHKHGKRLATVGGFIGAAVLLAVGAAHVIDKKRQS